MTEGNKQLSQEQREELLETLKVRFEKNGKRHEGLEWAKVQAKFEANNEKLWSLNEMAELGVNQMLLAMMKRRANTFFVIVLRKVQRVAEVFVTIVRLWRQGKKTNQKIVLWIWQLPLALKC